MQHVQHATDAMRKYGNILCSSSSSSRSSSGILSPGFERAKEGSSSGIHGCTTQVVTQGSSSGLATSGFKRAQQGMHWPVVGHRAGACTSQLCAPPMLTYPCITLLLGVVLARLGACSPFCFTKSAARVRTPLLLLCCCVDQSTAHLCLFCLKAASLNSFFWQFALSGLVDFLKIFFPRYRAWDISLHFSTSKTNPSPPLPNYVRVLKSKEYHRCFRKGSRPYIFSESHFVRCWQPLRP